MSDLRVGIMGFGGAGMAHNVFYDRLGGCRVTRILDARPEGRLRAGTVPGVRVFGDLDDFLEDLDAVSVCTPDAAHAEHIAAALARGIHVLTEKPLTNSIEGIRRIKAAERSSAATLGVLHQMRFVPLFQKMKAALDAGELGTGWRRWPVNRW